MILGLELQSKTINIQAKHILLIFLIWLKEGHIKDKILSNFQIHPIPSA